MFNAPLHAAEKCPDKRDAFHRDCAKPHLLARDRKDFMSNWDLRHRFVNGGLAKVAALLNERLSTSICLITFRTEPIPGPPAHPG